jgi:acyl-CoA thioesterase-1
MQMFRIKFFFIWVCFVTFLNVHYSASGAKIRILAFGDSLTAGYRLEKSRAYPAQLEQKLKAQGFDAEVLNAGVSGDTSSQALRRVEWVLKKGPFDSVLVCIGANDGLRNQPIEQLEKNLNQIIQKFLDQNIKVILFDMKIPVNLNAEYRKSFEDVYARVAKLKKVHKGGFFLEDVAGKADLMLEDQIHPNEKGYEIISSRIAKVFIQAQKK